MDKVEYANILIYSAKVAIRRPFTERINTWKGCGCCRLGCCDIRKKATTESALGWL